MTVDTKKIEYQLLIKALNEVGIAFKKKAEIMNIIDKGLVKQQ